MDLASGVVVGIILVVLFFLYLHEVEKSEAKTRLYIKEYERLKTSITETPKIDSEDALVKRENDLESLETQLKSLEEKWINEYPSTYNRYMRGLRP
jgi:hypothetical protein